MVRALPGREPRAGQLGQARHRSDYGLNYKDTAKDALAFLAELGDPFARIGADTSGRVAIDWGIYGVPETYVIGADGTIAFRQVGPIDQKILDEVILPIVARLQAGKVIK